MSKSKNKWNISHVQVKFHVLIFALQRTTKGVSHNMNLKEWAIVNYNSVCVMCGSENLKLFQQLHLILYYNNAVICLLKFLCFMALLTEQQIVSGSISSLLTHPSDFTLHFYTISSLNESVAHLHDCLSFTVNARFIEIKQWWTVFQARHNPQEL